ncbi:MAG: ParB-like nuclease domain protein [Firmicutes bacterium ADurb.Bin456]|nr:MAG: ParB-like nuclease domain protein [Firmicutes bacterium ADurb.Bin456]
MAKKKTFNIPPLNDGHRLAPGALDFIQDSRVNLPAGVKLSDVFQVEPGDLKDNDLNPELFKEETPEYFQTLEADIKERGILVPLIARKDGILLAGHNRLVIARRLGLARVPVQYLESELTPDQERALVIKDNLFRRQLTQEDRLRLYKVLIPDFDELIQKETRGAKPKAQGENRKRSGLTAADLTETAQAAGLPLTLETAEKDLAQARKAGRPKKEPAPETDGPAQETARRLKTIKAHCAKIIEALNQADEETTNQGLLQVLELVQTLAGDDSPLVANIEAMRAALE